MAGESCANCRYSRKVTLEGAQAPSLVCLRNPPIPVAMIVMVAPDVRNPQGGIGNKIIGYQAPVRPDTWCGEWSAAATVKV